MNKSSFSLALLTALALLALVAMVACEPAATAKPATKDLVSLAFTTSLNLAKGIDIDCPATIQADQVTVTVPFGTHTKSLIPTVAHNGTGITLAGSPLTSGVSAGDFSSPLALRVSGADGSSRDYTVTVSQAAPTKFAGTWKSTYPRIAGVPVNHAVTLILNPDLTYSAHIARTLKSGGSAQYYFAFSGTYSLDLDTMSMTISRHSDSGGASPVDVDMNNLAARAVDGKLVFLVYLSAGKLMIGFSDLSGGLIYKRPANSTAAGFGGDWEKAEYVNWGAKLAGDQVDNWGWGTSTIATSVSGTSFSSVSTDYARTDLNTTLHSAGTTVATTYAGTFDANQMTLTTPISVTLPYLMENGYLILPNPNEGQTTLDWLIRQ